MDTFRYYGKKKLSLYEKITMPYSLRYILFLRRAQKAYEKNNILLKKYYIFRLRKYEKIYQYQISPAAKIGKGFYIGHTGRVIINPKAVLGDNVNIATGVTIGQENRGKRIGAPRIGNCVWIGTNATIVGRITIDDDVLIAPNSYVNFDVPSHSIVIGNPAKIIKRDNATEGYIQNKV